MISELLPEDKRRLHELEEQVARLESQSQGAGGNNVVDAYDVSMGLDEMARRLTELDRLVNNEPKARRDDFRRRVEHLKRSHADVKAQLESYAKRLGLNLAHRGQKIDLFTGAVLNTDSALHAREIADLEAAEGGSLNRSNRMVGEYLASGLETLSELQEQRLRLKGVQKKVLDIMNYLGISNSIMKAVTDRDLWDARLTWIGMAAVLLLTVCLWWTR